MRDLSPALAAHLAGEVTTLARCWTLTRRDGVVMGFTDHDRDLPLDGVVHRARGGFEASDASAELGFAAASVDVAGVLRSSDITEADILLGRYDGAEVAVHLVDWREPSTRQRIDVFAIGEVRRGDGGFVAELRSAAHRFDEERGRLYTLRCDADLGDSRCRKAVAEAAGHVVAVEGASRIVVGGLAMFVEGWFEGGRLRFTGGANDGHTVEIARHRLDAGGARLDLWLATPAAVAVGDGVAAMPGCDKSFETCRDRFANQLNFQGFPHIPGNDFLLQLAAAGRGQEFDGGSLFR